MTWFEHAGSKIYYEERGTGDPVLLLPGWTESIEDLAVVRDALTSKYRVIAAELPGSGRSGPQPRDYPRTYYEDDAKSFLALLETLGTGRAHIVGFSDGGEVALLMATLDLGSVRSVAIWGAAGHLDLPSEVLDAFYNVIDSPTESLKPFSDHLKAKYGEANARAMTQSTVSVFRAIVQEGGDISRSRAGKITCPVLLITGADDFIAPPALVSEMASALSDSEFVEVKGAGHVVQETHPELLVQKIVDWLAKH